MRPNDHFWRVPPTVSRSFFHSCGVSRFLSHSWFCVPNSQSPSRCNSRFPWRVSCRYCTSHLLFAIRWVLSLVLRAPRMILDLRSENSLSECSLLALCHRWWLQMMLFATIVILDPALWIGLSNMLHLDCVSDMSGNVLSSHTSKRTLGDPDERASPRPTLGSSPTQGLNGSGSRRAEDPGVPGPHGVGARWLILAFLACWLHSTCQSNSQATKNLVW